MSRVENWQNELGDLIEQHRFEPFDFPKHNCLMWAFSAIKAVTGNDLSGDYRGKYKDEKEAVRLLKKVDDVRTSQELLQLKLGGELQPVAFARIGDIVFTSDNELLGADIYNKAFGPIPGVCYGMVSYFIGENGLIELPTMQMENALWVS